MKILERVAPYTMVHPTGVAFAAQAAARLATSSVPGVFVECGTWRGGSSFAMLLAQRLLLGKIVRPLYMFDSFEGLPPVDARDGPLAREWQQGSNPKTFLDNCRASEADVREAARALGITSSDFEIVPGWFKTTLPARHSELRDHGISLLRLDSDWYESTMLCLDLLMPATAEGATVIVDDYYAWDGCARALHEYLAKSEMPYRIKSLYGNFGAYFVKQAQRESLEVF